jgi:hypothetical protein
MSASSTTLNRVLIGVHKYRGKTELGNVAAHADVTVIDGPLIIHGSIGEGAKITIKSGKKENTIPSIPGVSFGGSVVINGVRYGGNSCEKTTVKGDVFSDVHIISVGPIVTEGYIFSGATIETKNASITCKDIDKNVTLSTSNSTITASNIGNGSTVKTSNAKIVVANVAANGSIKTSNAKIIAGHVAQGATIKSSNANINIASKHPSAKAITSNGHVTINGVKQKNRHSQRSNTIVLDGNVISASDVHIGGGSRFFQNTTSNFWQNPQEVKVPKKTTYTKSMQRYLKGFENKTTENHQKSFEHLNLDGGEELCCPISLDVPNIPCYLDGELYDLESLLSLKKDSEGMRTNPITREKFGIDELQPARNVLRKIEKMIVEAKKDNKITL